MLKKPDGGFGEGFETGPYTLEGDTLKYKNPDGKQEEWKINSITDKEMKIKILNKGMAIPMEFKRKS